MPKRNQLSQELMDSLAPLRQLPQGLALLYAQRESELIAYVNQSLESHPQCHGLIGYQPLRMMHDNHRNHFAYIQVVLHFGLYESLVTNIPWVLHAYTTRGFLPAYFVVELTAWRNALQEYLQPADAAGLVLLYQWLLDHLDDLFALSEGYAKESASLVQHPPQHKQQLECYQKLLAGELQEVAELAKENIKSPQMLKDFYLYVLAPSMYQLGQDWEQGKISVAQEHLVSAFVNRLMSYSLYTQFVLCTPHLGKLLFAASQGEQHEIGARMVADFLSIDGWDIDYLGANVPTRDLLSMLKHQKYKIIALSATMIYHILPIQEVIQAIRQEQSIAQIKIMVGGQALQGHPELWRKLGADGYAADAAEASRLAALWHMESKVRAKSPEGSSLPHL